MGPLLRNEIRNGKRIRVDHLFLEVCSFLSSFVEDLLSVESESTGKLHALELLQVSSPLLLDQARSVPLQPAVVPYRRVDVGVYYLVSLEDDEVALSYDVPVHVNVAAVLVPVVAKRLLTD